MNDNNPYAAPMQTPSVSPPPIIGSEQSFRIWNIEALKARLASRPLTDRESLPYLLIAVFLTAAVTSFPASNWNWLDSIGVVIDIILAVGGTIYAYHQNGGREGHHFLQRYLAVGFVTSVRCVAFLVGLVILISAVLDGLGLFSDSTSWIDVAIIAGMQIVVCWRVGHHIGQLARL